MVSSPGIVAIMYILIGLEHYHSHNRGSGDSVPLVKDMNRTLLKVTKTCVWRRRHKDNRSLENLKANAS